MSRHIFLRHAETDMAGTFCGHSDPRINIVGQQQVLDLIATLGDSPFDAIYCSDLQRTVDTAEALSSAYGVSLILTPALREIHFGEWEGLRWEEIERRDPAYAALWSAEFPKLPAPQGERYETFTRRVLDAVDRLLREADGGRIAVVTHAGVMRVVLTMLLGCSDVEAWERTRSYCCSFEYAGSIAAEGIAR